MIRELSFTELTVADWPAAVAWYRDVLGLEVELRDEAGRFALLRAGGGRLALKAGTPRPGTVLIAFAVDDLAAELERLAGHGVYPEGPVKASAEGYRRALLRDPDGYRLGLFDRQPAQGKEG
jgi:predicted enzyme related to lactoylglutathione lyase